MHRSYKKIVILIGNINLVTVVTIQQYKDNDNDNVVHITRPRDLYVGIYMSAWYNLTPISNKSRPQCSKIDNFISKPF